MPLISLVVPCHNEAESLPFLFEELEKVTGGMSSRYTDLSFEVVAVDDGSKDNTLDVLKNFQTFMTKKATFYLSGFPFRVILVKKQHYTQV